MGGWSFNFFEYGYVGVLDPSIHNGESLARIGDPATAYGDIARFREFADHYEQLQAERDHLRQQVEKLLEAVNAHAAQWDEAYLPDGPDRKTETMLARIWDDDQALYSAADQVRKELGEG
jgi:hypothetical protein